MRLRGGLQGGRRAVVGAGGLLTATARSGSPPPVTGGGPPSSVVPTGGGTNGVPDGSGFGSIPGSGGGCSPAGGVNVGGHGWFVGHHAGRAVGIAGRVGGASAPCAICGIDENALSKSVKPVCDVGSAILSPISFFSIILGFFFWD